MPLPDNTAPMMTGRGPYGPIEMGGMFTTLKVRRNLAPGDYRDPGWYRQPPGTQAWPATETIPADARAPQPAPTPAPYDARKPQGAHHGHHH